MKKILAILAVALLVAMVGCAKQPQATDTAVKEQPVSSDAVKPADSGMSDSAMSDTAVKDDMMAAAPAAMERVFFAFDQYTLSDEAKAVLEANAAFLMANPAVQVKIEGHCDERGSDEYNVALGEKRALAAKNYLVSLGVAEDRVSVISYGEERPLVAASNETAWAQNRRAEFVAK